MGVVAARLRTERRVPRGWGSVVRRSLLGFLVVVQVWWVVSLWVAVGVYRRGPGVEVQGDHGELSRIYGAEVEGGALVLPVEDDEDRNNFGGVVAGPVVVAWHGFVWKRPRIGYPVPEGGRPPTGFSERSVDFLGVIFERDGDQGNHAGGTSETLEVPWWMFVGPVILANGVVWGRWWRGRALRRRGFSVEGRG